MSGQLAGKWKTFIMAQKILQLITPSSIQNLRVLGGEGKVEILQPALVEVFCNKQDWRCARIQSRGNIQLLQVNMEGW